MLAPLVTAYKGCKAWIRHKLKGPRAPRTPSSGSISGHSASTVVTNRSYHSAPQSMMSGRSNNSAPGTVMAARSNNSAAISRIPGAAFVKKISVKQNNQNKQKSKSNILATIPSELLLQVCKFLPHQDIFSLARTSRSYWNALMPEVYARPAINWNLLGSETAPPAIFWNPDLIAYKRLRQYTRNMFLKKRVIANFHLFENLGLGKMVSALEVNRMPALCSHDPIDMELFQGLRSLTITGYFRDKYESRLWPAFQEAGIQLKSLRLVGELHHCYEQGLPDSLITYLSSYVGLEELVIFRPCELRMSDIEASFVLVKPVLNKHQHTLRKLEVTIPKDSQTPFVDYNPSESILLSMHKLKELTIRPYNRNYLQKALQTVIRIPDFETLNIRYALYEFVLEEVEDLVLCGNCGIYRVRVAPLEWKRIMPGFKYWGFVRRNDRLEFERRYFDEF